MALPLYTGGHWGATLRLSVYVHYSPPTQPQRHVPMLVLQILLSYGASPNCLDAKGLTPLYHAAIMGDDTGACITLLRHRAEIGTKDQGGWSELHHVSWKRRPLVSVMFDSLSLFPFRPASMVTLNMLTCSFAMGQTSMLRTWLATLLCMWLCPTGR